MQCICSNLAVADLTSAQPGLCRALQLLQRVDEKLPAEFWTKGPLRVLEGYKATALAVTDKVMNDSWMILQYVQDIRSLEVSASVQTHLDGLQAAAVYIQLFRHFQNGHMDFVPYFIFRTGAEKYVFGFVGY